MYLNALHELSPWLHDHSGMDANFSAGHFTVHKTTNTFSSILIDQAHEQNNTLTKRDGGAVGLTDNPSAFRHWIIAGPEVARVIAEFEEGKAKKRVWHVTRHHDQTNSVQAVFAEDVFSLVNVMEKLGNSFEEESMDLISIVKKEIAGSQAVNVVRKVRAVGLEQFKAFATQCFIYRTSCIDETIHRNKFRVFRQDTLKSSQKKLRIR
ncbi:hypothetical protein PR048_018338 [Dryococelus australis]|uniref:Uncharacterized protein n=1 Tax=Dryococelus australis TaxID=614101 RepID=A0ABQ9HBZ1_9NEOP|nr:hypothetical protein PR048_018338 [Dryococelus australis]